MTQGARGFQSVTAARDAALLAGAKSFIIIKNGRRAEYGWISPVDAYLQRAQQAIRAGITVMEQKI
jgi:hypothetical protein